MRKIILIMIALTIQIMGQTNITVPQLSAKAVLDSTDLFLVSQTDTNYYKYSFDNLIDQVEDSLNKAQIAYKNAANTFASSQTFSGGLVSSGITTISGITTFSNNLNINGQTVFNTRPIFYGALFNSAGYGIVNFNDSTYFNAGTTTFANNPVSFDVNSNLTVYGQISMISGAKLRLPSAIYSLNFSSLGYVGSDGDSYLAFDYGSTAGNRDTVPSFRYLRNNYAGLNSNNTYLGNNTFLGSTNTFASATFQGTVTFQKPIVHDIDSSRYFGGVTTLSVSGLAPVVVIYSAEETNTTFSNMTGADGQEVTIIVHPSTTAGFVFQNNSVIKLTGSINATLTAGDVISFVNFRGVWYEKSRSEK